MKKNETRTTTTKTKEEKKRRRGGGEEEEEECFPSFALSRSLWLLHTIVSWPKEGKKEATKMMEERQEL
jgi:hypothetical protein